MRRLLSLLGFHVFHHWGIPHRDNNNRLVIVCYECSKSRPVRVNLDASHHPPPTTLPAPPKPKQDSPSPYDRARQQLLHNLRGEATVRDLVGDPLTADFIRRNAESFVRKAIDMN